MKKLLFLFIGFVFFSIAVAAENDSSGFVGKWGGVFTTVAARTARNTVDMKIEIDSEGKIFLSKYEYNGKVVSPPKVVAQESRLLTLETKTGWTFKLALEAKDLIRASLEKPGNPPYTATLLRD